MRLEHSVWSSLLLPAAAGGLPVVAGAGWLLGGTAAALVAGGCAASAAAAAFTVARSVRAAGAQLRRRELRGSGGAGVCRPLLKEALGLLAQCESEAEQATRARTELEARAHVKRQRIGQLEAALSCLEHPLLITDAADRVLFCNPAATRLLRGDGNATNAAQPVEVDRVPALARLLKEVRDRSAATDRRIAEFDLQQGAEAFPFRATATLVVDHDQRPLGTVTLFEDISQERQEKTKHAEFVSSVCHELKTPMASIRAFTEMLMDGDVTDPGEQCELYGFIDVQVDRLTRLVNNMLNLARIESGVIKVQREDLELSDVLNKSLDVVRQLADEKHIRLVPELSDLYTAVNVDADLLGQAVINLLSNAIKYTPEGGEVRLRSRMDEGRAVVEVRDNGMGIPADSLPRLFERFYRVPENNKAAAGTGLGLALVHYIVTELHNGSIAVASEVGQGSCFTITVPLGHRTTRRPAAPSPAVAARSGGGE